MGNAKSIQEIDLEYKIREKKLNKEYIKCLSDKAKEAECVKNALIKGDKDIAKIHAVNVLRKKQEAVQLLELITQVDQIRAESKIKQYSKSDKNANIGNFMSNIKSGKNGKFDVKKESNNVNNISETAVNEIMSEIALESDMDLENFLKLINTG